MIRRKQISKIKNNLKLAHPGYKIKQISNSFSYELIVETSSLIYATAAVRQKLYLKDVFKCDEFQIKIAVDHHNKKIYWNWH